MDFDVPDIKNFTFFVVHTLSCLKWVLSSHTLIWNCPKTSVYSPFPLDLCILTSPIRLVLFHALSCISEFSENAPLILVIIFRDFTMFQYWSDSPQVKRNLLSSIANLTHKSIHELSNDLLGEILGNSEILEKT